MNVLFPLCAPIVMLSTIPALPLFSVAVFHKFESAGGHSPPTTKPATVGDHH